VDVEHKLIRTFEVMPANVHDSRDVDDLIDPANRDPGVWADRAYRSEETEAVLAEAGYERHLCDRLVFSQPLSV